jgi:hypothetical protein
MGEAVTTSYGRGLAALDIIWGNPCFIGRVLASELVGVHYGGGRVEPQTALTVRTRDDELISLRIRAGEEAPAVGSIISASARFEALSEGVYGVFKVLRWRYLARNP